MPPSAQRSAWLEAAMVAAGKMGCTVQPSIESPATRDPLGLRVLASIAAVASAALSWSAVAARYSLKAFLFAVLAILSLALVAGRYGT